MERAVGGDYAEAGRGAPPEVHRGDRRLSVGWHSVSRE